MAKTKRHWTHTRAGKAKLKARAELRELRKHREIVNAPKSERPIPEGLLGYAIGRTHGWLQAYAEHNGLSRKSLTSAVGEALRS